MSIHVMAQVWDLVLPYPTCKLILLALADCANHEGESYPSLATISVKAGVTPRNVQKTLRLLEEMGLVSFVPQSRSNGSRTVNLYRLTLSPPVAHDTPPLSPATPPPVAHDTPPLSPTTPLELSLELSLEPDRQTDNAQEADETLTARRIRDCVAAKRSFLAQRFPEADIDLETEEIVAKYRSQQLGADPWLAVLRWFRNLKDRPARAAPMGSSVTMAEALEMFPLKSFGGKRGPAEG